MKRRLYDPQLGEYALRAGFTLGTVPFAYANKDTKKDAKTNWNLFVALVIRSKGDVHEFERKVDWMLKDGISEKRNALAHGAPVSKATALALHEFILGDRQKVGMLPWLAEHMEPIN